MFYVFYNAKYIGLFLLLWTLVLLTEKPTKDLSNSIPVNIFMSCSDSVLIDSVYSENCSGSGPYIANWKIIVTYSGLSDNVVYQRNSESSQTYSPTTLVDTLTVSNIPADGGAYDTIKIWYGNAQTCGDTILIHRPIPCPSDVNIPCTDLITQAEGLLWEVP